MTGWCFFCFFSDATVFLPACASPPVTFKIAATALMRYSVSLCRDPDLCGLVLHTQQQWRRHPAAGGGGGEKKREKELRTVTSSSCYVRRLGHSCRFGLQTVAVHCKIDLIACQWIDLPSAAYTSTVQPLKIPGGRANRI